jgi:hypothetical protein
MNNTEHSNNRKETVRKAVLNLYTESEMPAAAWMWQTHVQIVAQKAEEIEVVWFGLYIGTKKSMDSQKN